MSSPCILVLGMHRSGTTATAAALHHLGYTMGHELFGPNEWNAKGYFEDVPFVRLDDRLLALMQRRWDSPLPPEPGDFALLRDRQPQAVELLRSRRDSSTHWGIKDPRMCLLAPFWTDALRHAEVTSRAIITLRHPSHVARSLARRDGIGPKRAAWLWLAHIAGALQYATQPGVSRFLAFDDLVEQPAVRCRDLAAWLGLKPNEQGITSFATDFITPDLAHRNDRGLPPVPQLAITAFQLLADACTRDIDPYDFATGEAWQATLAAFERGVMPTLRLIHDFYQSDSQLDVTDHRMAALTSGLEAAQKLAIGRAQSLATCEHALSCANESLQRIEGIAADRLDKLTALEEQLRRIQAAFAHAEKLALERFAEIKVLTQRIRDLQSPPRTQESAG